MLALSFVFGNSVRAVFEAMIFLFIEHAFDVGDIIVVESESFVVKARARGRGRRGRGAGAAATDATTLRMRRPLFQGADPQACHLFILHQRP